MESAAPPTSFAMVFAVAGAMIMASASWMMADHRRWSAALGLENGLGGKLLGRFVDHFGPLPWPLSKWTNARDVPMVPRQSFRSWWAKDHEEPK